jgi:hypothetical protein
MFKKEYVIAPHPQFSSPFHSIPVLQTQAVGLTNPRSITAGAKSKVKSSVQRGIRAKVIEAYPLLAPHIDEIIPKKSQLDLVKVYVPLPSPLLWATKLRG